MRAGSQLLPALIEFGSAYAFVTDQLLLVGPRTYLGGECRE